MSYTIDRTTRHNFIYNVLDGGFFGLAIGFASFTTIIPLFVNTLTDSAILIGLVPSIHNMGWQLPQLATARWVTRSERIKPIVLLLTTQERCPFLGFPIIAWLVPVIGPKIALAGTFFMLVWQSLGAGLAANGWQTMIGKIIPGELRGTFFGAQSAAMNLLASGGAIIAGYLLDAFRYPNNYGVCFATAVVFLAISFFFLSKTREQPTPVNESLEDNTEFWNTVIKILKEDRDFLWFLITRSISPFAMMAYAFYIVYAVRRFQMDEATAGLMTGVLLATQVAANPILGRIADRSSPRNVLVFGVLCSLVSSILASVVQTLALFYPVFILAGIANVAYWTIGITMTLQFGKEQDRPKYIGLTNTLVAPFTIIAPLIGGWLADIYSYQIAFIIAAIIAGFNILFLLLKVQDPQIKTG